MKLLCKSPISIGTRLFKCERCVPCLIARRKIWENRILLEAGEHRYNSFVNLSYEDSALPLMANGMPTLEPLDVQRWLKRFRKVLSNSSSLTACLGQNGNEKPGKIRFYLAGEYGPKTWRPHYHAIVFGYRSCARGSTLRDQRNRVAWQRCCDSCRLVGETWGYGDVQLGTVERASAGYVAGYIEKKMTRNDDPRLEGRYPEFARQSRMPGVGFNALFEIADVLMKYNIEEEITALRRGPKIQALGRYLRTKLRTLTGKGNLTDVEAIKKAMELFEEMRPLHEAAQANGTSVRQQIMEAFAQEIATLEARHKIFSTRKDKQ